MRSFVLGASAGVGRALARCLASKGHDLVLAARSEPDLAAEAAHLRLVYGVDVECLVLDATNPAEVAERVATLRNEAMPRNLLFPIGLADEADDCFLGERETADLIHANLTSVIAVVATLLPGLIEAGDANIVGFGSVAAVRGRGANVVYAAAKRGLESYFESLRHRTASSGVRVQFYRLGYVATQMSYGRALPFPAVAPEWVAENVANRLGRDLGLMHLPRFWAAITPAVRAVPWRLYRKAKF